MGGQAQCSEKVTQSGCSGSGSIFMAEFEARIGSCTCAAIPGLNIGTAQNMAKAEEMKLFETRCLDAVRTASDILEGML
jgi:hypothetical protein